MAEERKEPKNDGRIYDDIFNHVKSFGLYQKILFGLLNLLVFPINSQFAALVFAVGTPSFHCTTANVTCPSKHCCHGCKSYEFDGHFRSTVSEWNLICDRAYLAATVHSCYFAGMLVGSFASGMMSDAWGRKSCIFICNAIMLIAGVTSAFVDCISFFAFLRFLVGFGLTGVMLSLYIYGMEIVGPKHRTASANVAFFIYNVFGLIFLLISYYVPAWRSILIITTAPAVLLFPFWKWIPESPRWLISHNRLDEALEAIQKYGGKDDTPIDAEQLRDLFEEVHREQIKRQKEDKKYTAIDLLRTPRVRKWFLIVCFQWFTVALVGFGILLFLTQLSGDIYVNYAIMQGIGALRIPFTWIVFLKFGRRISHTVIIVTEGVCMLLILAVHKDFPLAATALSLAGSVLNSCSFLGVYIMTSELFPTILRNTAQGTGSTIARIGGIIAPYIAMLGQLPGLSIAFPASIFGVVALIAGVLMYWVPETLYAPMSQTIEEVETADPDFGIPCCRKRQIAKDEQELENMIETVADLVQ